MIFESKRTCGAVKFDGTNVNEIRRLMRQPLIGGVALQAIEAYASTYGFDILKEDGTREKLTMGNYLVREKGKFSVMSAEEFEKQFKPSFASDIQEECEEFVIDRMNMYIEEFCSNCSDKKISAFKQKVLDEIGATLEDLRRFK